MISHSSLSLRETLEAYGAARFDVSEGTLAAYGYAVRSLEVWLGRSPSVNSIDQEMLCCWLRARLAERSPKTVSRERGSVLTLLRWTYREGLRSQPAPEIPVVRVPRKNPAAWRPGEVKRLLAACKVQAGTIGGLPARHWWPSLIAFQVYAGPRLSAALAIRCDEVDLPRGTVLLSAEAAKTSTEQILRLHPTVLDALEYLGLAGRDLVWPCELCRRRLFERLGGILKQAGLPSDRRHKFHCLRRTCYTWSTVYGSRDVAQRQLGHKTDMSRYYLDQTQLADVQAADVLPSL
jgi:integrase